MGRNNWVLPEGEEPQTPIESQALVDDIPTRRNGDGEDDSDFHL